MFPKIIRVTQPALPSLEEFMPFLEDIWQSKCLTNNGKFHQELEKALCEYLKVKYISLFANGTLALITALRALEITGEVITTPFSFVATTHALWWSGITPVFGDIEPDTFNLNPEKIETAITPKTTAIMPVHVYGNPCDVEKIRRVANTYGLKIVYDACHAFGVKVHGNSILNYGDLSVLSFHATKVFTTFEGGAIVCHDEKTKKHIDYLKNFGIADETTVVTTGINAKLNEVQAAFGLLQLKYVDVAIGKRKRIAYAYREGLNGVKGIRFLTDTPGVQHNYSYFPIFINQREFGVSRDEVYEHLKKHNIYGRRYFYPLISQFQMYRELPSASPENLPVAGKVAKEVLCLPIYPDLKINVVNNICSLLSSLEKRAIKNG